MNDDSKLKVKLGVAVAVSIAVALLAWLWASTHLPFPPPFPMELPHLPPKGIPGDIGLYYILETVFSTVNATLLIFLLAIYAEIYVRRKVQFTLWLMIFCSVLLLDALSSNSIIQWALGFRPSGLGPFAMLPNVFTTVALAILLYLTLKY